MRSSTRLVARLTEPELAMLLRDLGTAGMTVLGVSFVRDQVGLLVQGEDEPATLSARLSRITLDATIEPAWKAQPITTSQRPLGCD